MHNRFNNPVFFISLLFVFFLSTVIVSGFSLVIDDSNGDSLLTVSAVTGDKTYSYPLLDQDLLSSGWILNINGEYISPAESGWLREYRESDGNHRLLYSNKTFTFENRWVLSSRETHILITAVFTNNSTESLNISPILLLDTYLGEVTGLPFQLSDYSFIRNEQFYEGTKIPKWIKSGRGTDSPSMTIFMDGTSSTIPQSLTLANWLRLKQGGVDFEPERGRSFDFLPFSDGDSALLIKYKNKKLQSGESMSVTLVIGLDESFPGAESFKQTAHVSVDARAESLRLREYTLRQRIRDVGIVIDAIDNLLDNSEELTGEDVSEIELKTVNQEKLRAEYENL